MQKLVLNSRLWKKAADITPNSFEEFLYVMIDKKNWKNAPFTYFLLHAYVNSHDNIINNLAKTNNDKKNFLLYNNIKKPQLLKEQTNSKRNQALISIVFFTMLYYA